MSDLRKLLVEATPGPWITDRAFNGHMDIVIPGDKTERELWLSTLRGDARDADAALIVYLRNHAEAIAALIEAAGVVMAEWDELGPTGTASTIQSHRRLRAALAPFAEDKP